MLFFPTHMTEKKRFYSTLFLFAWLKLRCCVTRANALFFILLSSSVCLGLRSTASSLSSTSITFCGSGPGARAGVGPVHTLIRHSCPAAVPWTSLLVLLGASLLLHRRSFKGTFLPHVATDFRGLVRRGDRYLIGEANPKQCSLWPQQSKPAPTY